MAKTKRMKKKAPLSKGQKLLIKESLRDLLGSGLLESDAKEPTSLFFLKDALNTRLLNSK